MYYEEFDNKENENNEFVDAEYENVNNGNDSSGGDKPPKKKGNGPLIALIIAIVIIGLGVCTLGGCLLLKMKDNSNQILRNQKETVAEQDIGNTKTSNTAGNYTVTDVSGVVED
ncbi:MAG: hypothetical protein J6Z02_11080, partial [Lachnospiraceae bacterium]|nr:hypothetical protein [Lachnospiraceae bacterium]